MSRRETVRAWHEAAADSLAVPALRAALEARRAGDTSKIDTLLSVARCIESDLRRIISGFPGGLQFTLGLAETDRETADLEGGGSEVGEALHDAMAGTNVMTPASFGDSTAFLDDIGEELLGEEEGDAEICWVMMAAYGFLRRIKSVLEQDHLWENP